MNDQTGALDGLAAVLGVVGATVGAVPEGRWHAPTPCDAWDVRALVGHMVLGNRLFAGIVRGEAALTPDALDPASADALGDDPAAAYRASADALLAAFRTPGALDAVHRVPFGDVPGHVAVDLRIVEELVHGRDLAVAIGRADRFAAELPGGPAGDVARRGLEFTTAALRDVPPDASPFGPPRPAPHDAPAIDRLAALLGRTVGAGT